MAKKFKINRSFTYKAYICKVNEKGKKTSKFVYKSECHYYVEKHILDLLNSASNSGGILKLNDTLDFNINSDYFEIINVTTIEDSERENYLIETIKVKNNEIIIKAPNEE